MKMIEFSVKLKELRKQRGVKQTDMAKYLNINTRHYQRYEAGEVDPPTSTTIALADYFNVSLDYLVGRSDNPTRL